MDLEEVVDVFEGLPTDEMKAFLDLGTGRVVIISIEFRDMAEQIRAELEDLSPGDDTAYEVRFAAQLAQRDLPEWMHEVLVEADLVEREFGARFIAIPGSDSHEAYDDMSVFIDTVASPRLRGRLADAIIGRGAFRRFKGVLAGEPSERERWFTMKRARARQRALDWLADEGIELEQHQQ